MKADAVLHIDIAVEDPPVSRAELDAALGEPPAANQDLLRTFTAEDNCAPVRRMIFTQDELDAHIDAEVKARLERPSRAALDSWMQTATGRKFWPFAPMPSDIHIEDIAAALSKLCRYGGHCTKFYSVAEHSLLVSKVVPPHLALQALLHDATEAYCVDMPRPIKHFLAGYAEIEARLWSAVAARFDLPIDLDPLVKQADNDVLLAEREQIMVQTGEEWSVAGTPADVQIRGLPPEHAEVVFLGRFKELTAT